MKKIKKIRSNKLNFIFTFIMFFILHDATSQLRGIGIEFNSSVNLKTPLKKGFGLDLSSETSGMYLNLKNLIGYKQYITLIHNESEDFTLKNNIIRHQIQGKFWFGNLIRARQIHRLRCAHRIKIREDYHFKPYILVGLDNSFMIGKNINDIHKLKAVTGIGTNIKKFGNFHSAQLLFIEIRPNINIINNFDHFENKFSIETSIGLKFY